MGKMNASVLAVFVAAMMMSALPAQAAIIGTEQMVTQHARAASLGRIDRVLAGAEVAAQLQAWGVGAEQVAERVATMSDIELAQLADTMETDPAGGVLVLVGVVFVVLIVLHLVGVLNVFR